MEFFRRCKWTVIIHHNRHTHGLYHYQVIRLDTSHISTVYHEAGPTFSVSRIQLASVSTGTALPVPAKAVAGWDSVGQPVVFAGEVAGAEVTSTEAEVVRVFEARFVPWLP